MKPMYQHLLASLLAVAMIGCASDARSAEASTLSPPAKGAPVAKADPAPAASDGKVKPARAPK